MRAINDTLRHAAALLQVAGVAQASLDARLLLSMATGLSHEAMIRDPDAKVSPEHAKAYMAMINRRLAGEPVSRIVGRREFWSLEFEINAETLDPRADSETLISAACDLIRDRERPLRILDIGAGSGCLLVALLSEYRDAQGVGIDVSAGALEIARSNAARLGYMDRSQWVHCDLLDNDWPQQVGGPFDLVISNPPYIPDAEIATLAPEVARHDPWRALAGGKDGLDFYRIITSCVQQILKPGGYVVFEAGRGQAAAIAGLLRQQELAVLPFYTDIAGIERAVAGRLPEKNSWKPDQ